MQSDSWTCLQKESLSLSLCTCKLYEFFCLVKEAGFLHMNNGIMANQVFQRGSNNLTNSLGNVVWNNRQQACSSYMQNFMHAWSVTNGVWIKCSYLSLSVFVLVLQLVVINVISVLWFLNQARAAEGRACLVSWNCFGSRVGMCVCPPPRPLITSGVI